MDAHDPEPERQPDIVDTSPTQLEQLHQLKTSMTVIKGYAQLLERVLVRPTRQPGVADAYLRRLQLEIDRVVVMISRLETSIDVDSGRPSEPHAPDQ